LRTFETSQPQLAMIGSHRDRVESASRQAVSEELTALGNLPSEAELSALVERYAGSRRVSCEQADLFFASIGEVVRPASGAPRDAAEVARGSWLDKLGPRSSAPPRVQGHGGHSGQAASEAPAALSIAAPPEPMPEEPITIEQALEHLPATTYSSAPPPSALPSEGSAPVALPLSSHPAPALAPADSVVVERWGMAETTPPEPVAPVSPAQLTAADSDVVERWGSASTTPPDAPAFASAEQAEEDALLDHWSDDLDRALGQSSAPIAAPPASIRPSAQAASERPSAAPASVMPRAQAASERPSTAPASVAPRGRATSHKPERRSSQHAAVSASGAPQAATTDAPERWSAPHLNGSSDEMVQTARDDDAPLSAAELSLLDQWSATDSSAPLPAEPPTANLVGRDSMAPRARGRTQPPLPPPAARRSDRPAASMPPPLAARRAQDDDLDVEVEEIELDPDDLLEIE
jgi:hypothetical protein